jgi:hypothetical protein
MVADWLIPHSPFSISGYVFRYIIPLLIDIEPWVHIKVATMYSAATGLGLSVVRIDLPIRVFRRVEN